MVDFLDSLISICQSYYERVNKLENEKYDMEKEVEYKDYKVWIYIEQRVPTNNNHEHIPILPASILNSKLA